MWGSIGQSLGIVQWDFTRRDHPRNPGRVSGSGPVITSYSCNVYYHHIAVLCFSYHVIYHIYLISIYLSFSFMFHAYINLRSGYGKELYVPEGTITV